MEDRTKINEAALPKCGIIMPISATSGHGEGHWTAVKELLSRAIKASGHEPAPVWENTSRDRVSERIIGNIFAYPMVVADISDLNPNVMLELGLRLASKKPTVVVVDDVGQIPFDIRDFHALKYPSSLSMLSMERFMDELASAIRDKAKAVNEDGYTPFLGNVVVDVVSPDERQVPLNQFVIDRLEDLSSRLSKLSSSRPRVPATKVDHLAPYNGALRMYTNGTNSVLIYFRVPVLLSPNEEDHISKPFVASEVVFIGGGATESYYALRVNDSRPEENVHLIRKALAENLIDIGGSIGVPVAFADSIPVN